MFGKKANICSMFEKMTTLLLITVLITSCAAPTYEDGTLREYSDMPWGTPASWEGSVGLPGMSGYKE